jgi:hypothetical protein
MIGGDALFLDRVDNSQRNTIRGNVEGMEPAPIKILSRAAFDLMVLSAGRHWVVSIREEEANLYHGRSSPAIALIWRSTTLWMARTLQPRRISKRFTGFRNAGLTRILHRFPVLRICPDDESSGAAERD